MYDVSSRYELLLLIKQYNEKQEPNSFEKIRLAKFTPEELSTVERLEAEQARAKKGHDKYYIQRHALSAKHYVDEILKLENPHATGFKWDRAEAAFEKLHKSTITWKKSVAEEKRKGDALAAAAKRAEEENKKKAKRESIERHQRIKAAKAKAAEEKAARQNKSPKVIKAQEGKQRKAAKAAKSHAAKAFKEETHLATRAIKATKYEKPHSSKFDAKKPNHPENGEQHASARTHSPDCQCYVKTHYPRSTDLDSCSTAEPVRPADQTTDKSASPHPPDQSSTTTKHSGMDFLRGYEAIQIAAPQKLKPALKAPPTQQSQQEPNEVLRTWIPQPPDGANQNDPDDKKAKKAKKAYEEALKLQSEVNKF
ncbi:hypothetical protein EG329_011762 [Mollisiaceae sp. DMI_Dod_QoI]|nr:hypothetical protein EG329_011762 [Helotiales sp. DMI_Dod_QoI]